MSEPAKVRSAAPTIFLDRFETATGEMVVAIDENGGVHAIDWADRQERWEKLLGRYVGARGPWLSTSSPSSARNALRAYFAGEFDALDQISFVMLGTPFQQAVWRALRTIPVGETRAYFELAEQLGAPKAVRAVGLANRANALNLVVPCHRVIGASGALTGYGGGIERKAWLLRHEHALGSFAAPGRIAP